MPILSFFNPKIFAQKFTNLYNRIVGRFQPSKPRNQKIIRYPKISQQEFSSHVKNYIEEKFPNYFSNYNFQDDFSFDCIAKSKGGKLAIWISTYNLEITVGFEENDGNSDSHWHLGNPMNKGLPELMEIMYHEITDIITDKAWLVPSDDSRGYDVYKETERIPIEEYKNIEFKTYKWSDF